MASLAEDLAAALDPVVLATGVNKPPDPWQAVALRSTASRLLLLCSRQSGKSTVAAVLAIHAALYEPGSLILMLSPSQRQSQELFRVALGFYKQLGRPVPAESENTMSLTLESGSRIVSLPGGESTIRGFASVRLLLVDEASRVPDETYFAARPMVAVSGGRIVLMSTPAGRRGFFFQAAERERGWEVIRVPATDCPRLSPAFLAEERATLGDYVFSQEYGLAFVEESSQLFSQQDIERAFRDDLMPLFGGAR
jgi:Terminase large subunit, T4likevirus-type, N-terminal